MATASLLCNIFRDVYQKDGTEYCMICFRTLKERRLVDGANVKKFKYFRQSNRLRSNGNTRFEKNLSEKYLVCYMCDRQAAAAVKFCIAFNLSNKLHYMFSRMKMNDNYKKHIINLLALKQERDGAATDQDKEAKESEAVLNKLRNTNNLLQTETLTLGNDIKVGPPHTSRGKLRDLLSFETKPVTDEDELTDLTSKPDFMTKTIFLEDDDASNDEPHPIAIIHNAINDRQIDTDEQTNEQTSKIITSPQNIQNMIQNQTGMILQPVILNINENNQGFPLKGNTLTQNNQNITLNNGTLTSINGQSFVINPIGGNISMPILGQYLNKDQFIPINNLNVNNQFILPVNQNSVLVPQNQNNTVLLPQNQNNIAMAQNQNINTPNPNSLLKTKITRKSQAESVSMSTLVGLKRSIDKKCQSDSVNPPTPVKSGKIDWEDKIPMDVISCVSNTDPSVQPQGNPTPRENVTNPSYTTELNMYKDPVDNFVITDVKSISEMPEQNDVIDLC